MEPMAPTVLALFGPTGVGKTALALAVHGEERAVEGETWLGLPAGGTFHRVAPAAGLPQA